MFGLPALDLANLPTIIGILFTLFVGSRIKGSKLSNQIIGWANLAISILTQIVAGLTGATPVHAAVFGIVPVIGMAPWLSNALHFILDTLAQMWLTTGIHSWTKNTVMGDTTTAAMKATAIKAVAPKTGG